MKQDYDLFKPNECYYLKKCEIIDDEVKPYFWQAMSWFRMNEVGQEVVDVRMYCYGKN